MDGRSLKETLHEQMESKSINAAKLAGLTTIPERFIIAILEDKPGSLPAPPYVRGYLQKMGPPLNLDGEVLWELYSKEHSLLRSGASDVLPKNRFVVKTVSKTKIFLFVLFIAFLAYIGFQAKNFLGVPEIEITNPSSTEMTATDLPSITVEGKMNTRDKLFINGENVVPAENGNFKKEVLLEPGLNTIEFTISRFLGKETMVKRQINYILR